MNALVVLAHPEPRSFCGALRDASVESLVRGGHAVEQSDLHAMRWQPVLGREEFGRADGDEAFFHVQTEQRRAVAEGMQSADVVAEQAKLAKADLVVLVFPVWWFGVPAILKGWIDRVFALDVADGGGRWFDSGIYHRRESR